LTLKIREKKNIRHFRQKWESLLEIRAKAPQAELPRTPPWNFFGVLFQISTNGELVVWACGLGF